MREIENARITKTWLGYEDHGIMTSYITLNYGGSGQSFGGWCIGGSYMDVWVRGVLKVLNKRKWEEIIGEYVQADHDKGKVYGIRSILGGEWFYPEEEFKKVKE